DREAMGFGADRDPCDERAGRRVERVDLAVVPAREPQFPSVDSQIPHVWTTSSWDGPRRHDPVVGEVDDAHVAGPVWLPGDRRAAAIGDKEPLAVPARRQSMRADAGRDESDLAEAIAVDD